MNNCIMREATKEELESVDKYIKKISKSIGINFFSIDEDIDHIKKAVNKSNIKDAVYKDGIFVCPNCETSTFPLALYDGDYCIKCGQHIRWREIVK